jgi:hypothetical protein
MTADELFLCVLDDLDERLGLGRGEYDAHCMAWLLRRLFHPAGRSLTAQVIEGLEQEGVKVDLSFEVRDDMPSQNVAGWMPILPTGDGRPTLELSTPEFLQRTALVVWPDNVQSRRIEISVERLILFLANIDGAVHLEQPDHAWQIGLAEFRDGASYTTADGQYTGGVFCLIDVARVARAGLEPLRVLAEPRVLPGRRRQLSRRA